MEKLLSPCVVNQHVVVRGESWAVAAVEPYARCTIVTLRGRGHDNFGTITRVVAPFDRIDATHSPTLPCRGDRDAVLAVAAQTLARTHRWEDCWTAATAKIDLLAWQLEPAIAAVSGATRLLLADGVGLGKTIQAALILSELKARRLITRALILTPAALREQWVNELNDRFALEAVVYDHETLARHTAALPAGVNPWATAEIIVSSIDLVKRPEIRASVDAVPFDLLIVDEAHHLTPNTDRGAVVASLAARTPWFVMVTATPHSGDERAYDYLCNLGALDGDPPLTVFRRSRGLTRDRRVRLQPVHADGDQQWLLAATVAYARQMWTGRGRHDAHVRLVASVLARRASSSHHALIQTLQRRLALLEGTGADCASQPSLPWDECDDNDDLLPDASLRRVGLDDRATEIALLAELLVRARSAGDAKAQRLRRLLTRIQEPVLVFTEYRDTIDALAATLSDIADVALLHGGLTLSARRQAIHDFVSGRSRVLLATDAAGEGLNLQARCRLVVNIELPWSPLRLEQRIGRVDRLGQRRRVHAIHLFYSGSFEDHVLAHLQRRTHAAGNQQLDVSEERIADAVFGDQPLLLRSGGALVHTPENPPESLIEQRRLISLLARRHRMVASQPDQPVIAPIEVGDEIHRLMLLFAYEVSDGVARVVERHAIALELRIDLPPGAATFAAPRFVQALARERIVDHQLRQQVESRVAELRLLLQGPSHLLQQRMVRIRDHIARLARAQLFQGSLFDKRAERRALAREAALTACRDHIERHIAATTALPLVHPLSPPRFVAAWTLA